MGRDLSSFEFIQHKSRHRPDDAVQERRREHAYNLSNSTRHHAHQTVDDLAHLAVIRLLALGGLDLEFLDLLHGCGLLV
jgi:hypothetical protein